MESNANSKSILIDITRCIGCHACEAMCKEIHGFPAEQEAKLSATAFTVVQEREGKFVRRMCMHCNDPACVSVCPVGALQKKREIAELETTRSAMRAQWQSEKDAIAGVRKLRAERKEEREGEGIEAHARRLSPAASRRSSWSNDSSRSSSRWSRG